MYERDAAKELIRRYKKLEEENKRLQEENAKLEKDIMILIQHIYKG